MCVAGRREAGLDKGQIGCLFLLPALTYLQVTHSHSPVQHTSCAIPEGQLMGQAGS